MAVRSAEEATHAERRALPGLFDSHLHLNAPAFRQDADDVARWMADRGMMGVVSGWDMPSSEEALRLARRWPGLYASVGIHPAYAASMTDEDAAHLAEWLQNEPRAVALGECGLDRQCGAPPEIQRRVFERQLDLAAQLNVPVVLHVVRAHEETLRVLRRYGGALPPCLLHGCSASPELAKAYLALGCVLSLGGPITWPGAKKAMRIAGATPAGALLLETDSPYQPPDTLRGQRGTPAGLAEICGAAAAFRHMEPEALAIETRAAALRFYRIEEDDHGQRQDA